MYSIVNNVPCMDVRERERRVGGEGGEKRGVSIKGYLYHNIT